MHNYTEFSSLHTHITYRILHQLNTQLCQLQANRLHDMLTATHNAHWTKVLDASMHLVQVQWSWFPVLHGVYSHSTLKLKSSIVH